MRKFQSPLLLVSLICVYITFLSSIPQARANPLPSFDPKVVMPNPFVFFIAEFSGLIVGTSILVLGAGEEWEKTIKIVILAMGVSYVLAYFIWDTIFKSGFNLDSSSSVLQQVLVILIPEILGTVIGAVLIRKGLEVNWKWASFSMSALMLASLLIGQIL